MHNSEKLHTALRYWYEGKGWNYASKALTFAGRYHTGVRKDGVTPEIHHQVSIAGYLKTITSGLIYPERTHVAAWVHDIREDYKATKEEFLLGFGNHDDSSDAFYYSSSLDKSNYGSLQEGFKAMEEDPIISIVKGADRAHNFQTMPGVFSPEKQKKYINECEELILPMLKNARKNFPSQADAYYNVIHVLRTQIELISTSLT